MEIALGWMQGHFTYRDLLFDPLVGAGINSRSSLFAQYFHSSVSELFSMVIDSVWFCGVSSIMWSEICKREIGEQRRRKKKRHEKQNKELKKSTSEVLERSGHIYIHELQLQSFNSSSRAVLLRKSRRRQEDPDVEQGWSVVTWWREEPAAATGCWRWLRAKGWGSCDKVPEGAVPIKVKSHLPRAWRWCQAATVLPWALPFELHLSECCMPFDKINHTLFWRICFLHHSLLVVLLVFHRKKLRWREVWQAAAAITSQGDMI